MAGGVNGTRRYASWGRYPQVAQQGLALHWRDGGLPLAVIGDSSFLPFGNGRSYGDVCLNPGGLVLDCRALDRFMAFDAERGLLRCEAGVLLGEILSLILPRGWFLPVTPGTAQVTLGGAIANDVHGKNHHVAGTFGCHVTRLALLRSDGSIRVCSPEENADWFAATIGGLGLTGVITWAEIRLKRVPGCGIDQDSIRFGDLEEFFAITRESDRSHEYTVAWIDCLARGRAAGRGRFLRGNHAEGPWAGEANPKGGRLRVPLVPPFGLLNPGLMKPFNGLYYHWQRRRRVSGRVRHQGFFYPLDAVQDWNRLYGPRGFFQYQCAIPHAQARTAVGELLERAAAAGSGSFLAVMKLFGDRPSPGLLSFPLPGATLALDFPNQGRATLRLLDALDAITREAGGRLYAAKDARMDAADFQRAYPDWRAMRRFVDPRISSGFWRRVTERA